ncbi:ABC transporter permease [Gulosibacter sp. 10]|uniref:ABC transporter permease n=1 Tax=Gulosibacter sp. 10 TaxID=1255570 RepID=UPI00097F3C39|nr:ABC transporter permease [Gulosibacter sp. 10]SJM53689.1 ABC-2:Amidohydrolase [Gulosibacter sp. 10]
MSAASAAAARTRAGGPGAGAWLRLVQAEARMTVRDTAGLIIPFGMPMLILVMQAMAFDDLGTPVAEGVTVLDYFLLPVIVAMVVATIAMINMPSFLATYRKTHLLRRLAVTPASPVMVLIAQLIVSFAQMLLGVGMALLVGAVFFEASMPRHPWLTALVFLAACTAMYGVGMIVASIAPTPNSAVAIGLVAFFGIGALGGMFGPVGNLPEPLAAVGSWLPFGAAVEALQSTLVTEPVPWQNWASLGGSAVIGTGVAALLFRWE